MGFDVKNTTKYSFLDLICPYTCRGCGRLLGLLCKCCKLNILVRNRRFCLQCHKAIDDNSGFCEKCHFPADGAVMVGWREGLLEKIVEEYKYGPVRGMAEVLAELLCEIMASAEDLWQASSVVVVPLPTAPKHIRERGFDHMRLLARKVAKKQGWKMEEWLVRRSNTVQVGATLAVRHKQAEKAYEVSGGRRKKMDSEAVYLLLDDVWTTGSSMRAAARLMRQAGAKKIVVAVIAVGR